MNDKDARKVVEAVLFASSEVLSVKQISAVLGKAGTPEVRAHVDALNADYEKTNRTFRIVRIGDGYQMRTLPMFKTWIQKVEPLKPIRLSPSVMETLAVVAYRQPLTRAEIEHLRGVDCSYAMRNLLEHKLVKIVGKDEGPGRALIYGTTREFLSLFNLRDLRELPTLEDFDLVSEESKLPTALDAS